MSKKHILIASSSLDYLNFELVAKLLTQRGFKVIVYEPDAIARGERKINVHLSTKGVIQVTYDGQILALENIGAAWYRRPGFYGPTKDRLRWLSIAHTYQHLERAIWKLLPSDVWLNDPRIMADSGEKLTQFAAAARVGFTILETTTTNSWDDVEALSGDKLIVKLGEQVTLPSVDGDKYFPTSVLTKATLPKQVSPYPGLWQPYAPKKREWRITVVGDKLFSAAIYTDKDAKDDWRQHTFSKRVQFKAESFPEDLQQKCIALLKELDLRYGAFDFIETPDGEIIFLEVNANGQFMWLERDLGFPISEAIADELVRIAGGSK